MKFSEAIEQEEFTLLAEMDPPKGVDLKPFIDTSLSIKGRVDSVVVTDASHAFMRMTPLAPCQKLLEHNMDPVMVVNGRDRNRLSFQGDLLAASALGVGSIILKEGQDPSVGDQPMVKTSGDLNMDIMLECAAALNAGRDLSDEPLEGSTAFTIGAALEIHEDVNVNRAKAEKLPALAEQGVRFIVLGPTYDFNILDLFSKAAEPLNIKLFSSVMMLKSVAMIRYLNNLPGVPNIPHEYLKQMMNSPVKSQAGMDIAASFIKDIEARCQGAVLVALGWGPRLPEFLDMLGR